MTISNVTQYTGEVPNRSQLPEDFETNVGTFLPWMEDLAIELNTTVDEINTTTTNITESENNAADSASTATEQADLAEEWASTTGALVDATDYSAKEYAIGVTVPEGSAKDWASSTVEVAEGFKGARGYAEDALASANSAAASASSAGVDFTATSSTSLLTEIASKTFAIETGKAFIEGQSVRVVSDADVNNYMIGPITNAVDGSITVNVVAVGGSGTFADWRISLFTINQSELDLKADQSEVNLKADANNPVITGAISLDGSTGTEGQVVSTDASGNTVWVDQVSPVSDRTLIATIDVSGASVAEFDGLFSSAYAGFEIVIESLQNTSNTSGVNARFKKGGTWLTTGYNGLNSHLFQGGAINAETAPGQPRMIMTYNPSSGVGYINSNVLASFDGVIKISNPNLSLAHNLIGDFMYNGGSTSTLETYSVKCSCVWNHHTGGVLEGIQLLTGGGTWSSGKIHLYGIRPL